MPGRYKRPATPADQARRDQAAAEKLAALHDRLAEQVAALRTGPDWRAALATAARFHTYSFGNTLLIAAQRPDAAAVAGYAAWQALGRHVDKGQKGIAILAPVIHRSNRPAADSDSAEPGRAPNGAEQLEPGADDSAASRGSGRPVGFRVAYVWDVAQTSGQPLPETPAPQLLAGQAPDGLWDALAQVAVDRGFTVTRAGTGPANGITNFGTRTVTVRPDLDDAQAVKTLAHELGHVLLHDRTVDDVDDTATSVQLCRGVKEVEAESVAYLIAAAHGLSTEQYTFPYVTGWAAGVPGSTPEQVVRDTGRRVLAAAGTLLAATQPATENEMSGLELGARADTARDHTAHLREQATVKPTAEVTTAADSGTPVEVLHAIHAEATRWYTTQLHAEAPDNQRAAAMLADRGVPPTTAAAWELGYAPAGWTGLTEHLRATGHTDSQLLDAGLGLRSARGTLVDRFRDRLMFPVRDTTGEHVIAFLGRAVRPAEGAPKYLNSPETALYRKSDILYGLGNPPGRDALAAGGHPVLVEGPLDAIAVTSIPGHVGVGACGTALTPGHVAALERAAGPLADRGVTVGLDPDPAGRDAAVRAYPLLRASGAWPQVAGIPAGRDPAALACEAGPAALAAALDRAHSAPLVQVVLDTKLKPWANRLQWPEGRLAALRAVIPVLATVPPDQVAQQISRLADRLGLDAGTVSDEVVDTLVTTPSAVPTPPGHPLTESEQPAPAATAVRTSVQLARAGFPAAEPSRTEVAPTEARVREGTAAHRTVKASARC